MEIWEGKIKGYNELNCYVGTYQATIERYHNSLYKMKLSFYSLNCVHKEKDTKQYLKNNLIYSSSIGVLKVKFRSVLLLQVKSKVKWQKRHINV
ncbi:hypothetical protein CN533_22975 [Priestia megaterium]|uniref:hypothetical protein n=1 Tax=Priestia megaterium TaxID=1404 RepID=UPI000BF4F9E7|nr:hypothetical protein [Priestia megaterium]PET69462.1 hypothetical protein CN533_22975 [Priestia megaterium]PFK82771.1 hypothetical protein COJ19_25320 [Priestia megaterium]